MRRIRSLRPKFKASKWSKFVTYNLWVTTCDLQSVDLTDDLPLLSDWSELMEGLIF